MGKNPTNGPAHDPPGDPPSPQTALLWGIIREFERGGFELQKADLFFKGMTLPVPVPLDRAALEARRDADANDPPHPIEEEIVRLYQGLAAGAKLKGVSIASALGKEYTTIRKHLAKLVVRGTFLNPERSGYIRGPKFPEV
jgi:hypothetical protein